MLKSIKKYELSDKITYDKLLSYGFSLKNVDGKDKLSLWVPLFDDIDLFVEINVDEDKNLSFDSVNDSVLIDDNFGQYYTPFYMSDKPFHYLNVVVHNYNLVMDDLVSKGILKEKIENIVKSEDEITRKRTL